MRFQYINEDKPQAEIIYPDDFEEWVYDTVRTNIIYNRFKRKAQCIRCGGTWDYEKDERIYSGDIVTCPCCRKKQRAFPHTSKQHDHTYYFWLWNSDGGIDFAIAGAAWVYNKEPVGECETDINIYPECRGRISPEGSFVSIHWDKGYWIKQNSIHIDHVFLNWHIETHDRNQRTVDESFLKHCMIRGDADPNRLVKELDLFRKHPAAEYIRKAGLEELITNTIYGMPSYIRPNWKAKTVPGILRLSNQDVDKLKSWGMFDVDDIAVYQLIRKYKRKVLQEEMREVKESGFDMRELKEYVPKGTSPIKFIRYMHKQYEAERQRREQVEMTRERPCHMAYYIAPPLIEEAVKREYVDYLDMLRKLGYPKDDYYLYPKDLKKAHDAAAKENTARMNREAAERNKEWNRVFKETVLRELERFAYRDGRYVIRPLRSKEEFVEEGRMNKNCVASYADRAKAGKTKIFVLRKAETPDVSYVTIELSEDNKRIMQCFETGNRIPPEDVREWADKWLKTIVWRRKKGAARNAAQQGGQMLCQTA